MKNFYKVYLWTRAIVWCGVIFYLSSIPHLKTELGLWDFVLRKFAHALVFGILFLFVHSAIDITYNISQKRKYIYAVIFCILYAISDEYHQSFVPGRNASAIDVLIDSLGVFASAGIKLKTSN